MDSIGPNKTALITGASSGIGRALALEFASAGFSVFLTGRDETALNETAVKCRRHGVEVDIFAADLADTGLTNELITQISNRHFDVLINNAGFGVKGDFVETLLNEELEMLQVQLTAMLKLTKALLPKMIARKSGHILNV